MAWSAVGFFFRMSFFNVSLVARTTMIPKTPKAARMYINSTAVRTFDGAAPGTAGTAELSLGIGA